MATSGYIVKVTNSPVYSNVLREPDRPVIDDNKDMGQVLSNTPIFSGGAKVQTVQPLRDLLSSVDNVINADYQKWHQQISDTLNTSNFYGNPSVLLNSDFYWNTGVPTPVTQADPDGTFFSEKWQVNHNGSATFSLAQTAFPANDPDQTGSTTYMNLSVSAYDDSGDLCLYQRQTGSQFLRRYQGKTNNFSSKIINNGTNTVMTQYQIYYFFDPSDATYIQGTLALPPGLTELGTGITTPEIGSTSVGAGAYVEYRFVFKTIPGGTADIDIIYLKSEMADNSTVLYVDHALERARIDNS